MPRKLRVGYARIMQETNAFSALPTTLEDFRNIQLVRGAELAAACGPKGRELPAYVKNAELSGFVQAAARDGAVEGVPLFAAWAIPGGPLTKDTFEQLMTSLGEEIDRAGHLDGIFVSLHGAMGVEGTRDPDTEILRRIRAMCPKPIRLAGSFDLHANLTQARVEAADILTGYRTNPHRDHAHTGARAARLLFRTLRGEIEPCAAWRSLPMILGGGLTVDLLPPVRSLFARLRHLDRTLPCVSADVFFCHFLNDDPHLGYSTLAYSHRDRAHAEAIADELAETLWSLRDRQVDAPITAREAISRARSATLRRKTGVMFFADASDAVGAGGSGENTLILEELLAHGGGLLSYVPLRDPAAIDELWPTPAGERVTVKVGGKLDPRYGKTLEVTGILRNTAVHPNLGRMIWLDLGHVQLVLCTGPALAVKPEFWTTVGLSPWKADIIVAKSFFSFLLYFAPMLRGVFLVKTHGSTDFDRAFALPFDGPIVPRDPVAEWRTRDALRRQSPSINVGNSPRG